MMKPAAFEAEFKKMRALVIERSKGMCELQASPNCTGRGCHVHHRKTRSQGGENSLENLRHACLLCHSFIHAHPEASYAAGWLVPSWGIVE